MKKLIEDPEKFYQPKLRPSGHDISMGFSKDNGGAIPSNLLQFPNTESNGHYLVGCKAAGVQSHPARFPTKFPEFFIRFLTDRGDIVLDIFAGSNTTGEVAEMEGRRWIAFEERRDYVAASAFRFLSDSAPDAYARQVFESISAGQQIHLQERAYQTKLFG